MHDWSRCGEHAARPGPLGADTPKHQTYDWRTHCDFDQRMWAEPEGSCGGSGQAAPAASALQSRAGSWLIHSLQQGSPSPPSLPPSLPPRLSPEASRRLHLDVAARRRAGFPLLSVRHAAVLYLLHWLRCAAAQQTPEVRRCCDRVLPSSTVGQMKTNFKLCKNANMIVLTLQDLEKKKCIPPKNNVLVTPNNNRTAYTQS